MAASDDGPGDVTIRPSREDDFEAWFALFEAVASEGRWIGAEAPMDREWASGSFRRALDDEHAVTLLAEADGQLVGIVGISVARGVAELGMLVRDGYRGRGIGAALLSACVDWCRTHRAHKIALQVWPHNTAAIALYERHGFVHEGRLVRHWRRRNGELWDAVCMGLVLDTTSPGSPWG